MTTHSLQPCARITSARQPTRLAGMARSTRSLTSHARDDRFRDNMADIVLVGVLDADVVGASEA